LGIFDLGEGADEPMQALVDVVPEAALIVGPGGRIAAANALAAAFFGYALDELKALHVSALAPEGLPDAPAEAELTRGGATLRRRDGRRSAAEVAIRRFAEGTGACLFLLIHVRPERSHVDDDLRHSEERLRQAVRAAQIGIFDHDHGTDIHYWSPRMRQIHGWGADEPVTMPAFLAVLHPDDRSAIAAAVQRAHDPRGDGLFDVEHRIVRRDGELRWIRTRSVTIFAGEGAARHPVRTVGAIVDFTERRRADDALELFRQSIESSTDAVFWLRDDGRFEYVNHQAVRALGYTREELLGLGLWDIDPHYPRSEFDAHRERFERAGTEFRLQIETTLRRKDGTSFPVDVISQRLRLPTGSLHVAYARDISVRKQAEEGRDRLVAILDATPDFVAIAGPSGGLLYLNLASRRLLHLTPSDDISAWTLDARHPQETRNLLAEIAIPGALRDGVWKGEAVYRGADGNELPVSLLVLAHKNASGQVAFLSTVARDISKEKSLEALFLQSQKMEAIGRLAGGVAHDFNNILSVVLSFATLAADGLPLDHPARDDLQEVTRAAERAAELTRQMLAFSRKQVLKLHVLHVNTLLERMVPMIRRLIGEDIELLLRLDPNAGRIKGDDSHLEQAIMNLVVNARDAMPRGGTLTLGTADVFMDDEQMRLHPDLEPGFYATIIVSDTGVGMDATTRGRVFEPFFTTKGPGQGTGLGLSTVFGIVKQSGGGISVDSEVGEGARFTLYFPRTEEPAKADAVADVSAKARFSEAAVVLLVEDEPQLRRAALTVLRRAGYRVLDAAGPVEALARARSHPGKIDLLLTDVVMPQLSGRQLADQLLKERPETRVLYMSGYTEDTIIHQGVIDRGVHFLPKPIAPDALLQAVRRVLEAPAV